MDDKLKEKFKEHLEQLDDRDLMLMLMAISDEIKRRNTLQINDETKKRGQIMVTSILDGIRGPSSPSSGQGT
jgi:L-serine deaminase